LKDEIGIATQRGGKNKKKKSVSSRQRRRGEIGGRPVLKGEIVLSPGFRKAKKTVLEQLAQNVSWKRGDKARR